MRGAKYPALPFPCHGLRFRPIPCNWKCVNGSTPPASDEGRRLAMIWFLMELGRWELDEVALGDLASHQGESLMAPMRAAT
jgi:hypothetical protein